MWKAKCLEGVGMGGGSSAHISYRMHQVICWVVFDQQSMVYCWCGQDPIMNPGLVKDHPTTRQDQILQQLSSLKQVRMQSADRTRKLTQKTNRYIQSDGGLK